MNKTLLVFITTLILVGCQTTSTPDYEKFYQVEQKDYYALCFNLNNANFMFKTNYKFTGLADLGYNLLMLEYKDKYFMVQVFQIASFIDKTGLVAAKEIHDSFYEFEKEYQLSTGNWDFSEGYEIVKIEDREFLRFTYYAPNFGGGKTEVYKVISYGWISDQSYIQFFIPISAIETEDLLDRVAKRIILTFKSADEPITEENMFTISEF